MRGNRWGSATGTGKREEEGLLIYPTEETSNFRLWSTELPALCIVLERIINNSKNF